MRRVEYKRREEKEKREKRVYDCLYENLHVLYFIIFLKINLYLYISLLFKSTPSFFELCKSIRARVV